MRMRKACQIEAKERVHLREAHLFSLLEVGKLSLVLHSHCQLNRAR